MPKISNEYYVLGLSASWRQIKSLYEHVTCTRCNGSGETGSWLSMPDEDVRCKDCNGHGYISHLRAPSKPKIPNSFMEHMKKAYEAYLALPDNFEDKEEHY